MTVTEKIEDETIAKILNKIISNESITNAKTELKEGSKVCDGFMSKDVCAEIIGDNKTVSVFVKIAPKDENVRGVLGTKLAFDTEIRFYNDISPELKQGQDRFNVAPKCYLTSTMDEGGEEYIVLDNLYKHNYRMRELNLNKEEILLVLKKIAAFHTSSFVLKQKDSNRYKELTKNLPCRWSELFGIYDWYNRLKEICCMVQAYVKEEDEAIREILNGFSDELKNFTSKINENVDEYSILVHGDIWINNLMFKYSEDGKVNDVCLLDFQLIMKSSPIVDVSLFLFTCSKNPLDDINYYFNYYYSCLANEIKFMNCNIDELYPKSIFEKDLKIYGRYGILYSAGIFRILLRDSEEDIDVVSSLKDGKAATDSLTSNFNQQREYSDLLINLIRCGIKENML